MPSETIDTTTPSSPFLTRRRVQLAAAGGGILVVVLTGLTLALSARGISIVSNVMLTCLCLLPMVICLFPIYMVLVFAVYGMSRVNELVEKQFDRAEDLTEDLKHRSTALTENLNRRSIHLSAALARLDPLFSIFDHPRSDGDHPNNGS